VNQLILTRDEGEQLYSFEGKHVVPLDSESGNCREWLTRVNHTQFCIINEGDEWTLMHFVPERSEWVDDPADVDDFLATNKLILAS
jgi:hypothetical protein